MNRTLPRLQTLLKGQPRLQNRTLLKNLPQFQNLPRNLIQFRSLPLLQNRPLLPIHELPDVTRELIIVLGEWLLHHVLRDDMMYSDLPSGIRE